MNLCFAEGRLKPSAGEKRQTVRLWVVGVLKYCTSPEGRNVRYGQRPPSFHPPFRRLPDGVWCRRFSSCVSSATSEPVPAGPSLPPPSSATPAPRPTLRCPRWPIPRMQVLYEIPAQVLEYMKKNKIPPGNPHRPRPPGRQGSVGSIALQVCGRSSSSLLKRLTYHCVIFVTPPQSSVQECDSRRVRKRH